VGAWTELNGSGQADCVQCSEVLAWRCGWGLHCFARSS